MNNDNLLDFHQRTLYDYMRWPSVGHTCQKIGLQPSSENSSFSRRLSRSQAGKVHHGERQYLSGIKKEII